MRNTNALTSPQAGAVEQEQRVLLVSVHSTHPACPGRKVQQVKVFHTLLYAQEVSFEDVLWLSVLNMPIGWTAPRWTCQESPGSGITLFSLLV